MARNPKPVTDAELSILQELWKESPLTVRQLTERLYPELANSDLATVQKLLQRLEAKNLVARDRSSHTHTFSATVERNDFAGRQLSEMAARLSEGSLTPLLLHLLENKKLSNKELDEIRQLLDRHR